MSAPEFLKPPLLAAFYGVGRLAAAAGVAQRYRGRAGIVCYHRIVPDGDQGHDHGPNAGLCVSISRFSQHMELLSRDYSAVSMDDLVLRLNDPLETKFSVAVTFDDGYKDNLHNALPVLERFGIPATIYVATRFTEGEEAMWWVELWDIVKSRTEISVAKGDTRFDFDLNGAGKKRKAFSALHDELLSATPAQFDSLLAQLRQDRASASYPGTFLTWAELEQLDRHPLITLGAHTHSHFSLSTLAASHALKEIESGKAELEARLGHKIKHFAYPYGRVREAGPREYDLCRSCRFDSGVTTECMPITHTTDRFALPRHCITRRHSARDIAVKLSGWNALWGTQA